MSRDNGTCKDEIFQEVELLREIEERSSKLKKLIGEMEDVLTLLVNNISNLPEMDGSTRDGLAKVQKLLAEVLARR